MDVTRLRVTIAPLDDGSVVKVEGELGPSTSADLDTVLRATGAGSAGVLILDLTNVTALDAGTLRVIHDIHGELAPGRKLCAVACGRARRAFELTRLDALIEVYNRLEDAVAAATGEPRPSM